MFDICSSIKKFNEYTTTIKELIFSSLLLLKNTHTFSHKRMEVASHWEIFHIQLAVHKWYIFTLNNNSLQRLILAFFSLEVRSLFWIEFSNVKWTNFNKFIETGAAIFASLWARNIFIFTQVSRECQRRQKQGEVLLFRAFFVFTRLITYAQFKICRTGPHMCFLRGPSCWNLSMQWVIAKLVIASKPFTVNGWNLAWSKFRTSCASQWVNVTTIVYS